LLRPHQGTRRSKPGPHPLSGRPTLSGHSSCYRTACDCPHHGQPHSGANQHLACLHGAGPAGAGGCAFIFDDQRLPDAGRSPLERDHALLQKGLKILGYDCKREDGYFSNDTVEALKQFESDNNLTVDGIYQDHDKDILLSEILIFVDEPANDYQYKKLLEIMN